MKKLIALTVGASLLCFNLMAQQSKAPKHGKPPFVTACEGKQEGDACMYTDRSGSSVNDQCKMGQNPRGESELLCGSPKLPPKHEKPSEKHE